MNTPYRIMYRLGFTPWDTGIVPPGLSEVVEGANAISAGRALDLGCGTGTQSIYLAHHNWRVTGVDFLERPLEMARRKAAEAGVQPHWVQGDITHLTDLGVGEDYDLILDLACFHGLKMEERPDTARQITSVAAPGATFVLGAFAAGNRGPLPRGIETTEVTRLFGGEWELLWRRQALDAPLPGFLKKADPTCYCLRKKS